jgi:glycine dehydrogenase
MQSNRLMRSSMDVATAELAFNPISFAQRHIGPQADDVRRMLQVVRAPSLDALIDDAMPGDIRQSQPLGFGPPLSEPELLAKMRAIASRNHVMVSLSAKVITARTCRPSFSVTCWKIPLGTPPTRRIRRRSVRAVLRRC